MKYYCIIVLFFLFFANNCKGLTIGKEIRQTSKIDSLVSDIEIETFIHLLDTAYSGFKLGRGKREYQNLYDSLKIKAVIKADFDKNGLTDILVTGGINYPWSEIICILDSGRNKYTIKYLSSSLYEAFATTVDLIDQTGVVYYTFNKGDFYESTHKVSVDTLVYKFGDFIEYHNIRHEYNIQKLEFTTTKCFGLCPEFEMSLNKNTDALFNAISYNYNRRRKTTDKSKEFSGKYHCNITQDKFDQIINLLNYIDFPRIKDEYHLLSTCHQTATLKITYNNDRIKSVKDYGLVGTLGLVKLYRLLFDLRFNQDWIKDTK